MRIHLRGTPLALITGLCITAALFIGTKRLEDAQIAQTFEQRATSRAAAIQEKMEEAVRVLSVVNQLFKTIEQPSRAQFHTFTAPLLQRHPSIQALNFHRMLTQAERGAYEAAQQRAGLTTGLGANANFSLTTLKEGKPERAALRARYYIVDYLEPMRGNQAALGRDIGSDTEAMAALELAIESGQAASTDLLQLAQSGPAETGFLVLMPVYRPGAAIDQAAARRKAWIGDTTAVFRVGDLVQNALSSAGLLDSSNLDIKVYGNKALRPHSLAFQHSSKSAPAPPYLTWLYETPRHMERCFIVAGQHWLIVTTSAALPMTKNHLSSLLVLIAGLLLTLLMTAYLQALTLRSRRVQTLVEQKTTELRLTNDLLSQDIVARQQAESALNLRERAIQASPNAILIISAMTPDYPIEYANPAFERITGYAALDMLGRGIHTLEGRESDPHSREQIHLALLEQREGNAILRNHRKDGTLLWIDFYIAPVRNTAGIVSHFVAALYDITSMKRYEAKLEFQANRDALTGLANLSMLREKLSQAIAYAGRYQQSVVVLFINLDRFKFINDTLGHKAGDILLKSVAERLQASLLEHDIAARLGSDEFVLMIPARAQTDATSARLQHIMQMVANPVTVEGHTFFLTCSIGVATYPADGDHAEVLIKHADIAMHRAKQNGRNNVQFYTAAMNQQALERLHIESDLHHALERQEFVLHYQPKVDVLSGRINGMEALIRWQHPERGMVAPDRFIGLAEETGLIIPIGAWVIRSACLQNQAWQQAGYPHLRISVNLSARQFAQKDLLQSIASALRDSGLAAHYLELELTESLVMSDVEHTIEVLQQLKALGVQLSIDDFGTGYSSLAYLKRFPIDVLKIDQSFVRDITRDFNGAAITASIITLAHNLKLKVIAEGVETEAQLAYLRHHGCDEVQGYLLSRPLNAAGFETLLQQDSLKHTLASAIETA